MSVLMESWTRRPSGVVGLGLILIALPMSDIAKAGYFKVKPEVTEWRNDYCRSTSGIQDTSAACRAMGGTLTSVGNALVCEGADEAAWEALPVTEKVKRFSVEAFNICDNPDVTFTDYGHPAHDLNRCWSPTIKSRYGEEYWSTGSMMLLAKSGANCDNPFELPFSALRTREVSCPAGTTIRDEGDGQFCYKFCPDGQILVNGVCELPPEKNCQGENYTNNPCNVATGNKYRSETDYSNGVLGFTRHYNSQFLYTTDYGVGWRSSYQREIIKTSDSSLVIVSPAGRGETWQKVNDVWQGDADTNVALVETATGYRVTLQNSAFDDYNSSGQLVSQTDTNGHQQILSYNANGQLETVSNQYGQALTFDYTDGRLSSITDALGEVIVYQYQANGNLEEVIYPDDTPNTNADNPTKTYHYERAAFPHHLTGITDENGERYATFAYDENGKAITSELGTTSNPDGQEKIQLEYQGAN